MGPVYIGTSGFVYKGWEKMFYPEDISAKEHLEFYATQFPTVEINVTFYRLPSLKMVKGWRDRVPEGFVFAVKGSRYITHLKRLKNLEGGLNKFIRRIAPLKERLGPILWQLPPNLGKDPNRLDNFLKQAPKTFLHAVEFRHRSWYDGDEAFEILRKHKVAHVSLSSLGMPVNLTVTGEFVYIRFHGLENGAAHDYTRQELELWAQHICEQRDAGRTVYAYFNNDLNVRAPANAKMLMEMIGAGQSSTRTRKVAKPHH
jgi:uncharacterized protein YecE (DUF72 family)